MAQTVKNNVALTHLLFGLLIVTSLTTPSWRYGPFSWWPLWTFEELAGGPVQLGALNLLPVLFVLSWVALQTKRRTWRWGASSITYPLFLFSLWALFRLEGAPVRLLFIYAGDLAFVWLIYLYYVNLRPPLVPILATVIVVQSTVGCLQFLLQRDLGLTLMGELPLNPAFEGVTVLSARGEPWLRAYGLTAHPNLLGALLALSLMLLLSSDRKRLCAKQGYVLPVFALGLAGLFFSFSRSAWLGCALGLVAWLIIKRHRFALAGRRALWWLIPGGLLLALVFLVYGDLVLSRVVNLQQPVEARSITQRLYDAQLALQLTRQDPWLGVGLGRNMEAASQIGADAERVHNVLLLASAELGLPGLALVLILLLAPTWALWKLYRQGDYARAAAGVSPWLVVLVVNQFDTTLWLTGNWQTAILFGLAAGNTAYQLMRPANDPSRSRGQEEADRNVE